MDWTDAPIEGCEIEDLRSFEDERGWLAEFFRSDETADALMPAMGYVSATLPGVARGPHEHVDQTDLFVLVHGRVQLYCWDAREGSPTYGHRQVLEVGSKRPTRAIVPPGVVHAYHNIGDEPALIVNCPNRLYAGEGKQEEVDEIRHEDDPDSPFQLV